MHMKATDLNRALNYVDDAYLMEADTPYKVIEIESKEIKPMKTQKKSVPHFTCGSIDRCSFHYGLRRRDASHSQAGIRKNKAL